MAFGTSISHGEVQDRVGKTREKLEKEGIIVRDARIRSRPMMVANYEDGRDFYAGSDLALDARSISGYDVSWTLELNQHSVETFLHSGERLYDACQRYDILQLEFTSVNEELKGHLRNKYRLRETLRTYPGIAAQRDEFMVMLKMAGFDGDIA